MLKRPKSFYVWSLILGMGVSFAASFGLAAKLYRFTGEVTAVHKNSVTVRRGTEEAEFARPDQSTKIKIGDRVTVLYGMDAKQVLASPQAPGTVPDVDAPDQHVIMDDPAFFNAKNQSAPNAAPNNAASGATEQKNPG